MNHKIECPYCDGYATSQRQSKDLTYRKEVFRVVAHYYKCEKCGEEFTTTESDTITLMQAHNQYREKNNIPFPQEIAAIREKYELSAAKMSEVLGLGANGYSNYEKGEMPLPAIANLITTAAKPEVFEEWLDKARVHFSENAFKKAKDKIAFLIEKQRQFNPFYSSLNIYNKPNNYTGYKLPSADRIASLIANFIQKCKPEFNDKLKLNKLLFFTDFCHYKNYGQSVSGLSYRAIQYGPVPSNYDNIYTFLENEQIIASDWIRLPNGSAREVFITEADFDPKLFTAEELETVSQIAKRFDNISTWDIVELSHEEKAWKELEANRELIGYQDYAFELQAV